MSSSHHLPEHLNKALRSGRAIPFLVDHRHEKMPDCTLTVIGLIDTRSFEGVFLPDDFAEEEMVRVALPEISVVTTKIKADCADAEAVHELWSLWIGGMVDRYLDFVNALAMSISLSQLDATLGSATPVDRPKPKAQKSGASAKARARKRTAAAKRSKPRK
jgi:hypothetical protein